MSPELTNGMFAIAGAVVGALIGVLGSYLVMRANRERRQLSCIISEPISIVEPTRPVGSLLEIRFGGARVSSVYLLEISIINTGNKSVPIENMTIHSRGSLRILTLLSKGGSIPEESLNVKLGESGQLAEFSADFINPGEQVQLSFLTSGKSTEIDIEYRKPDIKILVESERTRDLRKLTNLWLETANIAIRFGSFSLIIRK